MTWVYGTGPKPKNNCSLERPGERPGLSQVLSAMMQLQYVGDEPVPAQATADAQKDTILV